MAKKKFYAVAVGRSTGIFSDWPTAEKQVKGFAGAKYKSFATEKEASTWLENPVYEKKNSTTKKQEQRNNPKTPVSPDAIVIYTDGGSINNPGPGGYGIVIKEGGEYREISGGFRYTTNNRMEMTAAIVALTEIGQDIATEEVHLYSDSSYLVNGIEKGWAKKWSENGWLKSDKKMVANIDLWKRLLDLLDGNRVTFHWVKGHAGNELNERCDRLAVSAARQDDLPADVNYEQEELQWK